MTTLDCVTAFAAKRSFWIMRSVLWLLLAAGCYTYAPIDASTLAPGMNVRARVSATQAQQLEPLLGTPDLRLLNGVVIGATSDTVIIEVPSVTRADVGSAIETLHQRVGVPRPALLEVETRTLDRFKTYAVAGVAGAIVGGWVLRATVLNPGKEGQPGGGGPGELTIPLFRIR